MCLAVPGRIESIHHERGTRYGRVDFGGVSREVCLEFVPEAAVGDWALVHVGFALARLDEDAARATLEAFERIGLADGAAPAIDGGPGAATADGPACPRFPGVAPQAAARPAPGEAP